MDHEKLTELRRHYDGRSTAREMDGGRWEKDTDPNPMVGTSIRLPRDVLTWVREQAEAEGVGQSVVIRRAIERDRAAATAGTEGDVRDRLARLEQAVFAVPEPRRE